MNASQKRLVRVKYSQRTYHDGRRSNDVAVETSSLGRRHGHVFRRVRSAFRARRLGARRRFRLGGALGDRRRRCRPTRRLGARITLRTAAVAVAATAAGATADRDRRAHHRHSALAVDGRRRVAVAVAVAAAAVRAQAAVGGAVRRGRRRAVPPQQFRGAVLHRHRYAGESFFVLVDDLVRYVIAKILSVSTRRNHVSYLVPITEQVLPDRRGLRRLKQIKNFHPSSITV